MKIIGIIIFVFIFLFTNSCFQQTNFFNNVGIRIEKQGFILEFDYHIPITVYRIDIMEFWGETQPASIYFNNNQKTREKYFNIFLLNEEEIEFKSIREFFTNEVYHYVIECSVVNFSGYIKIINTEGTKEVVDFNEPDRYRIEMIAKEDLPDKP